MAKSLGEHTFVRHPTPLLGAPEEGAEQVSEALPGEPLQILETQGGWTRVNTAYDYPGWLPHQALGGEPASGWPELQAVRPLDHAKTLIGTPYRWGGMTDRGIDCSGLVHMSFRATGRLVPRDAQQQEAAGTPVDEPSPGDLVSYGSGETADHVAFWLGEGRILHATRRDGVDGVLEEPEPEELRTRRRRVFRL